MKKPLNIDFLTKAERDLASAHLTMDLTVIDNLLHRDYSIIQSGGKIETKQEVLDAYRSGNRHWDTAEVDELKVQIYDNMAKVIGRWQAKGSNNGVAFNYQARFISIWIREKGQWQNISYAASEINSESIR
jgi:hypothetical protein